jgi:hypothetical protein
LGTLPRGSEEGGLGGAHLGTQGDERESIRIIRAAIDAGVSVTITGCDRVEILEQALEIARGFTPLSGARSSELLSRAAPAARGGWEKYKHPHDFDGTVQHPEWLGHPA